MGTRPRARAPNQAPVPVRLVPQQLNLIRPQPLSYRISITTRPEPLHRQLKAQQLRDIG